ERHARAIERGGEKDEPELLGIALQLGEGRTVELEPAEQLDLRFAGVGRRELVPGLGSGRRRHALRREALELDGVRPRLGRRVDEPARELELAVVIDSSLRDPEARR